MAGKKHELINKMNGDSGCGLFPEDDAANPLPGSDLAEYTDRSKSAQRMKQNPYTRVEAGNRAAKRAAKRAKK